MRHCDLPGTCIAYSCSTARVVIHERARNAIPALAAKLGVDAVFVNGDYEPAAIARDDAVGCAW